MKKKNQSFSNLEQSSSSEEDLNTTQKSTKSQQYIASKSKTDPSRSLHKSKNPNPNPEFSIPKQQTSQLTKKSNEASSKIQQLEKEVSDNEIKFTNQPILLLNIDDNGKILLNKKALHLLKKITTYVQKS